MIRAYILIVCRPGLEENIVSELKKRDEVKNATEVYGEYDIIAEVELEDISELRNFVLNYLRKISGIEKTTTLIAAE